MILINRRSGIKSMLLKSTSAAYSINYSLKVNQLQLPIQSTSLTQLSIQSTPTTYSIPPPIQSTSLTQLSIQSTPSVHSTSATYSNSIDFTKIGYLFKTQSTSTTYSNTIDFNKQPSSSNQKPSNQPPTNSTHSPLQP